MEVWFFLFFSLVTLSSCGAIIFPFFICSDYRNQIKIKVSLPLGQETHAYLTLANKITFLAIDKVKWKKEDRSIEENITFYMYKEYVQIGENNIPLNFYGRYRRDDENETRNYFPSILSFGYNPQGISTSIVHQFYKSKMINRMIFGIYYYKEKEKGGNIYIGDIPKQLTESKTKGKCKVNDNQWGCEIKDFYYGLKNFVKNVVRYRFILWNDRDFDFGYLEDLMMTKLEFMSKYFRTARIAVGEEEYYNQINLTRRLGEIGFERVEDETIYVNINNAKRFFSPGLDIEGRLKTDEKFKSFILPEIRRRKARSLFYKMLNEKSQSWWD